MLHAASTEVRILSVSLARSGKGTKTTRSNSTKLSFGRFFSDDSRASILMAVGATTTTSANLQTYSPEKSSQNGPAGTAT